MSRTQQLGLCLLTLTAWLAGDASVQAQQFTVQQPVFREFTAGTTVSVPDRGRAFIGGVSRGVTGRTTTGPFRSGSGTGFEYENSSVSAHVWIHDFEELDRQALEAAARSGVNRVDRGPPLRGVADHAWRTLQKSPPGIQSAPPTRIARRR